MTVSLPCIPDNIKKDLPREINHNQLDYFSNIV